jgi:hypothetical protein
MFVLDNHLTTTQNVDVDEDLKEKLSNSVEIKCFVFLFLGKILRQTLQFVNELWCTHLEDAHALLLPKLFLKKNKNGP